MITCLTCGAGNRPTATVCRMCAQPLESSDPSEASSETEDAKKTGRLIPTKIFPNLQTRPGTIAMGEEILCPGCQAANEAEWLFCHQCGRQLNGLTSELSPAVLDSITGPVSEPERSSPGGRYELEKTEVIPAPVFQQPPPVDDAERPQPPDARVAEPPERGPGPVKVPSGDQIPQSRRIEKPPVETRVEAGRVVCPHCGLMEKGNSTVCSGCGSPLTVAQTVVMSSIAPRAQGRLRHILDGGESGEVYNLQNDTVIGRTQGSISFAYDELMSSKHGRIVRRGDDFIYIDEDSRNGTFIKIKREVRLEPGDVLLIGKQLFRFEA